MIDMDLEKKTKTKLRLKAKLCVTNIITRCSSSSKIREDRTLIEIQKMDLIMKGYQRAQKLMMPLTLRWVKMNKMREK